MPTATDRQRLQVFHPAGHDHPIGSLLTLGAAPEVFLAYGGEVGILRQIGHHGFEIESSIADMERQKTSLGQFCKIQVEGFA